jgi:AmmeMemoRadiSam system protein B
LPNIRPPAVAGSFYPAAVNELNTLLDDCFISHLRGPKGATANLPSLIAGVVPHAGYLYSGPCAAHFYASLDRDVKRVILLGVNHRARGRRAALSPWGYWHSPLGDVRIDSELSHLMSARVPWLAYDTAAHESEHSIEVQLPFLQRTLSAIELLPISLADLTEDECAELGTAIATIVRTLPIRKPLILASSDLSHYLTPLETEKLDRMAIERILALDPAGLRSVVAKNNITMCGVVPASVMLYAAKALGAKYGRLLKHSHSGEVAAMRGVVGYASIKPSQC